MRGDKIMDEKVVNEAVKATKKGFGKKLLVIGGVVAGLVLGAVLLKPKKNDEIEIPVEDAEAAEEIAEEVEEVPEVVE
jgi:hypothetical protein